jgi:hypothetical protein
MWEAAEERRPVPKPEALRSGLSRLREAAVALRRQRPAAVLAALERVRQAWLAPDSRWLERAVHEVAATTGFHPQMVRHALPLHFAPLHSRAIRRLFAEEGVPLAGASRGNRQAPQVVVFVLAGNLPGLAVWPAFLALAAGCALVLKPAAGDPAFPELLQESVETLAPELAAALWVLPWRGGDRAVEDVLFAGADVVVAQGSDTTIADLSARLPGKFVGYGSRLSFAFVGWEVMRHPPARRSAARRLAYDVSVWDQRGCLSPHVCLVGCEKEDSLELFARAVAEELTRLARCLPARQKSVWEEAAIRQFREEAAWSGAQLLGSEADSTWSVSVEKHPHLRPTCGLRCLRLQPVRSWEEVAAAIGPHRRTIEAAGIAASAKRSGEIKELLRAAGVANVVALGQMQRPTLAWKPGGRPRLREWFRAAGCNA